MKSSRKFSTKENDRNIVRPNNRLVVKERNSMKTPVIFAAIAIIFCATVCFFVFIATIYAVVESVKSNTWPVVAAKIDIIEDRNGPGGRSPIRYLYVKYDYNFNGRSFVSDNVGFFRIIPFGFKDEMRHWKIGQSVSAYVNPQTPSYAVLCRQMSFGVYIVMALSAFMAICLTYFFFVLKRSAHAQEAIERLFLRGRKPNN